MEEFQVKLDRFEGPYTKLLEMIESRKLSITEIGLTAVADDYISYIKSFKQEGKDSALIDISQFILVASTLMLMKAKSLLPGVTYTNEEEKEIHVLEHKLELYSSLNKAALKIKDIYMKNPLFSRKRIKFGAMSTFITDKNVTKENLNSIAILTVASFKVPESLVKVEIEQKLRIENVIDKLLERIQGLEDHSFLKIVHKATHSFEDKKKILVVNFLALLELVRMGNVNAKQEEANGDILITSQKVVPQIIETSKEETTKDDSLSDLFGEESKISTQKVAENVTTDDKIKES